MPEQLAARPQFGPGRRPSAWLALAIVACSGIAWLVTVAMARAVTMPNMAATPLAALVIFGAWLIMMAAMMLPSEVPMLRLYGKMAGSRPAAFAAGYLLLWALLAAAAYVASTIARGGLGSMAGMSAAGRPTAVAIMLAVALYQLSPLKNVCLRHCRSPLAFVMNHWRDGWSGALRMGLTHGCWCAGCCAGLMALLFAVGVMNLPWMLALALIILAEKALPGGPWLARAVACALTALALGFALSPALYSLATQP